MKLGPVAKLDNRNKATSERFDNNDMLVNCDVIAFFFQFHANMEPLEARF